MNLDVAGIGAVADLAGSVINKIWPDKSEQEKQQLAMALTIIQGQINTNIAEAQSPGLFKGGWRPFVGWVCGAACAWNWMGISIAQMVMELIGRGDVQLAPASLTEMLPLLVGMLGMGAMRMQERLVGKA